MPNKFTGEWKKRPSGDQSEEYDYSSWSAKRRAWEFLRRSEAYQQDCRNCANVSDKRRRNELADEYAEKWKLWDLVPFHAEWSKVNKKLSFVMYGPNFVDPKEDSEMRIPKTKSIAFFRVNVGAALNDRRLIDLQLKNIERRVLRFRKILRKENKLVKEKRKPKPVSVLKKSSIYYVKYLRALDLSIRTTSGAELWEKLHKGGDLQKYDPPSPSDRAFTSKHLTAAKDMADNGYLKFIILHRMEKIRPKRKRIGKPQTSL